MSRWLTLLFTLALLAACSSQPSTGRPDASGVGAGNGGGAGVGGAPGSGPILAPIGGKLGPADSSSK
jgi:hypothetical protein